VGSMHFVNPLTAMGLVQRIKDNKSVAAIQTGAASQCGRMIIKLCQMEGIPLINVVRRDEQVKLLKEEYGAEYVLNSSTDTFFDEIKELAKKLRATTCIECVGGPITAKLMDIMPPNSQLAIYGCLSEKEYDGFDPLLLIGRNITLRSFILGEYLQSQGIWIIQTMRKAATLMNDKTLQSTIHETFTLSQIQDQIGKYYKTMTAGKMILCPNDDDPALQSGAEFEPFDIKDCQTE